MKRIHNNRIGQNWYWGFLEGTKDLFFYIDGKNAVIMSGDIWVVRSL